VLVISLLSWLVTSKFSEIFDRILEPGIGACDYALMFGIGVVYVNRRNWVFE